MEKLTFVISYDKWIDFPDCSNASACTTSQYSLHIKFKSKWNCVKHNCRHISINQEDSFYLVLRINSICVVANIKIRRLLFELKLEFVLEMMLLTMIPLTISLQICIFSISIVLSQNSSDSSSSITIPTGKKWLYCPKYQFRSLNIT